MAEGVLSLLVTHTTKGVGPNRGSASRISFYKGCDWVRHMVLPSGQEWKEPESQGR